MFGNRRGIEKGPFQGVFKKIGSRLGSQQCPAQETALFIRCSLPKPSGVSPLRPGSGPPAQRRAWTHHIEPT